ncbi:hypothetical protein BRADI_1g50965v3 [Brachypodium distachyon]|uniref:Endonuclease/exonuclease/phosphatase domain-containing protein n=1 Tax=Brachypodium distachyon TaxID=15368 RepID=A0A2K2DQU8_BRADI|nr:hypothetical protein BRADI_1g50965v3 [Brachypodium distachyon]
MAVGQLAPAAAVSGAVLELPIVVPPCMDESETGSQACPSSPDGPDGPALQVGPDSIGPDQRERGPVLEGASSGDSPSAPVQAFLAEFSAPTPLPLLPIPAATAPTTTAMPGKPSPPRTSRSSGRLAAKSSRGLSTMEKVQLVLLKKNGGGGNDDVGEETKLASVSQTLVSECLGSRFCKNFVFKPALGTRGGVLVAVSDDFQISKFVLAPDLFSLTGLIQDRTDGSSWTITAVYGPNDDGKKIQFMQELRQIKQVVQAEWLIAGDFNLISRVPDKSNDNVDLRMMGRFRVVLDDLELIDLPIWGRRFTWSNEREDVTLSRIDRILISKEWGLKFPAYQYARL